MKPHLILALLLLVPWACALEAGNLEIDIPKGYEQVPVGESLLYTLKVFNLAEQGRIDVVIQTSVINHKGVVISSKSETVAVETTASFVRTTALPADLPAGAYKIRAVLTYSANKSATAERYFELVDPKKGLMVGLAVSGVAAIIIVIVILLLLSSNIRKALEQARLRGFIHRAVSRMKTEK